MLNIALIGLGSKPNQPQLVIYSSSDKCKIFKLYRCVVEKSLKTNYGLHSVSKII